MVIGLDVGSTTIKCVVLDDSKAGQIVYQTYARHFSQITAKTVELLEEIMQRFPEQKQWQLAIAGSAGMGMAEYANVPFVQEVYAAKVAAERNVPGTDCIIELGGEDAKIIFPGRRHGGPHERHLCRRHRRLYRPDGHAAGCENGGHERPGRAA